MKIAESRLLDGGNIGIVIWCSKQYKEMDLGWCLDRYVEANAAETNTLPCFGCPLGAGWRKRFRKMDSSKHLTDASHKPTEGAPSPATSAWLSMAPADRYRAFVEAAQDLPEMKNFCTAKQLAYLFMERKPEIFAGQYASDGVIYRLMSAVCRLYPDKIEVRRKGKGKAAVYRVVSSK